MSSKVQICSNAGLLIGQEPINDLLEVSDKATLAFNLYDYVRDSVIRANNWACCIKRVTLSPDVDAPAFGFAYQFSLPADCLRVLSISYDEAPYEHRVEGLKLLCNTNQVALRYLFRNVDELSYDAGLIEVMTLAMAVRICPGTSANEGLRDRLQQDYRNALIQHRAADSQQGTTQSISNSPMLSSHSIGLPQ